MKPFYFETLFLQTPLHSTPLELLEGASQMDTSLEVDAQVVDLDVAERMLDLRAELDQGEVRVFVVDQVVRPVAVVHATHVGVLLGLQEGALSFEEAFLLLVEDHRELEEERQVVFQEESILLVVGQQRTYYNRKRYISITQLFARFHKNIKI